MLQGAGGPVLHFGTFRPLSLSLSLYCSGPTVEELGHEDMNSRARVQFPPQSSESHNYPITSRIVSQFEFR